MAICELCGFKRNHSITCIRKNADQIPYGMETHTDWANHLERCPCCGVGVEGYHHPGCEVEECHKCNLRKISCECE
ncbi:hypothetical protein ACFLZT_03600 [Thermodesulfobacteriota bacterium]